MTHQSKTNRHRMASINTAIWQNPRFRVLPPECKLLYCYLLTNPDLSDLGTLPLSALKALPHQFGLSEEYLSQCLQRLDGLGFALRKPMTGFLWLPDYFWHNPIRSLARMKPWEKIQASLEEGCLKPQVIQAALLAVQQFTIRGYTELPSAFQAMVLNPHSENF